MTATFARACPEDEAAIRVLQAEAIDWLATKGTDQWQPTAPRNPRSDEHRGLTAAIQRGEVWIVVEHGKIIATFTLDEWADPDFWREGDNVDQALYLHRMIVRRSASGRHLGRRIIERCEACAKSKEKTYLRLDAWRTNQQLHAFYVRNGFKLLRVERAVHRGSGALFEKRIG